MSQHPSPRLNGDKSLGGTPGEGNSPRLGSKDSKMSSKSSSWRAATHIGSVPDDWPMYSAQASDYVLGPSIGFGASSVVYQASFKPLNGRLCAVKVIDLEVFGRDMAELRRETQLMSLSKHPNVLRVRGCWVDGSKLYIASRLMNSGSMLDIMRFSYPEGFEEVVIATVLKQALEGLNYLHVNNWLHRDVKAANMLVDEDGTVLLGDFGVGVSLGESSKTGHDSGRKRDAWADGRRKSFVGTPCWMAPEVVERKGYGVKADIWSFGITALEMTSGRAPHSRLPALKILAKTLKEEPPELDRTGNAHKYSKQFDDLIKQCLQKDAAKRPSAEKLLSHSFFKQAKSKKYLVQTILAGLPPLTERQERSRAVSLASLQNSASWDFGSMSSRLNSPSQERSDPFYDFSGAIASPNGSTRSSRLVSKDSQGILRAPAKRGDGGSIGLPRKSRPNSAEYSSVVESWGRKARQQRHSVSFDFDATEEVKEDIAGLDLHPHELPIIEETKADSDISLPGAGTASPEGKSMADSSDISTPPSTVPTSVDGPVSRYDGSKDGHIRVREPGGALSQLFRRL